MKAGSTRIFAGAGAAQSMQGAAARGGLFRRMGHGGAWEALSNGLPPGAEVHAILTRPGQSKRHFRRHRGTACIAAPMAAIIGTS